MSEREARPSRRLLRRRRVERGELLRDVAGRHRPLTASLTLSQTRDLERITTPAPKVRPGSRADGELLRVR